MPDVLTEYRRPWKLATLAVGIVLLLLGSYDDQAPDWDAPICFIMAICTYFAAPWSLRMLLERRRRMLPMALFVTWFSVDGCYFVYWHFRNPRALELMRDANFFASLSLYGMCAVIWLYRGSLTELVDDLRALPHLRAAQGTRRSTKWR